MPFTVIVIPVSRWTMASELRPTSPLASHAANISKGSLGLSVMPSEAGLRLATSLFFGTSAMMSGWVPGSGIRP
ncbi:hypothetical protein [Bifidobacterium adolescentis]|uniref:hypothetical protein n=1 Tax=Bifidobacterium adolescentis TaxID=1680 RepID=UPI0034A59C20